MRGYLSILTLTVSLLLIHPIELVHANPFCHVPEADRDSVAAFACKANEEFMTCYLLSELGYMQLEIHGKGGTIPEQSADIPPEFHNITSPEQYVNAVSACIQKSTATVDPLYKKAKSTLQQSGNKGALEALKDLYSYWMTSMNVEILTKSPGSPFLYSAQIQERKTGITERVNRLKVEL